MKTSALALILALGCTGPKDNNRHPQQSEAPPPQEDPQASGSASGSGSIVGNALTGDETIVHMDISGPYIGVEGARIYNYNATKERGTPVSGDVKIGDKVVTTELPQRAQVIRDLTNDLFILIREEDYVSNLKADVYLIRKSDGNVWQIYTGPDFFDETLAWVHEPNATTLYFAGQQSEGEATESAVYGVKIETGSEEVTRVKLANARPFEITALLGDEVTFNNDKSSQLWVTKTFSKSPVIQEVAQLGFQSWQYTYTSGRAYRVDRLESSSRIVAVFGGPHQGQVVFESDRSDLYSPQWSMSRNGVDIVSTNFGDTYIIDHATHTVVKKLSIPDLDKQVEILESGYVSMVTEVNDSGLCIVSSSESPVAVICSDKLTLGVSGRPYKITSIDAFLFRIFSQVEGTNNQQEMLVKIVGERLEVQAEVSTPYAPQADTLIPIKNIYSEL